MSHQEIEPRKEVEDTISDPGSEYSFPSDSEPDTNRSDDESVTVKTPIKTPENCTAFAAIEAAFRRRTVRRVYLMYLLKKKLREEELLCTTPENVKGTVTICFRPPCSAKAVQFKRLCAITKALENAKPVTQNWKGLSPEQVTGEIRRKRVQSGRQ